MEEEEKERRLKMMLEKQRAIAESLRMKREAEQKAKEEAERKAAEEERLRKEAERRAEEEKWNAMCALEAEEVDMVSLDVSNDIEGIVVGEHGVEVREDGDH